MTVKKTNAAGSKPMSRPYRACASLALQRLAVRRPSERTADESSRMTLAAMRFMNGLAAP